MKKLQIEVNFHNQRKLEKQNKENHVYAPNFQYNFRFQKVFKSQQQIAFESYNFYQYKQKYTSKIYISPSIIHEKLKDYGGISQSKNSFSLPDPISSRSSITQRFLNSNFIIGTLNFRLSFESYRYRYHLIIRD
ncbi:hypothetical protein TTHERM_00188730 (macronuclear) [Tetrahymena thermophila SB210]|uniref:Uncharacterized protein n=1 Tax=Tetrahymena thermophila (strain SB210) TaxID=312017 RepID=I7MJF9_TETTS|nr:hypothetical protein TTHERM_00188730 [Tetrahymena thermophila SB210]EAR96304.1 hypothetical protein TTHERM_00188730 [Tetrahymena thermophila SB210]|eukprot:XP_001016549.1 hypothetical protein TTHERM_00188730 [Tetrahymena thermophila SB210]